MSLKKVKIVIDNYDEFIEKRALKNVTKIFLDSLIKDFSFKREIYTGAGVETPWIPFMKDMILSSDDFNNIHLQVKYVQLLCKNGYFYEEIVHCEAIELEL